MRLVILSLLAVMALTLVPAPPADAQGKKKSDKNNFDLGDKVNYELFFRDIEALEALRLESRKLNVALHKVMKELAEKPDKKKEGELRHAVRELLLELRRIKTAHIEKVNPIIRVEPSGIEDLEALKALRRTSLGSVDWKDKYFRDCVALIEKATGLEVHMHAMVNTWNGVYLRLPNVTADTVLKHICHGFNLKWFVYKGEVYIVRKVDVNEARYKRWEKKHGTIDYWKKEEWKEEDDDLLRRVDGKMVPQTVFDMDLGIIRQNLLKFFIFEEESRIHQTKLKKLRFEKRSVEKAQLAQGDPKLLDRAKTRERHVVHYLRLEKESAIETLEIISRVLGDKIRLDPTESSEWRKLLDTSVEGISWQQLPLDEALGDLGRRVGVEVVAEIPLIEVPYISLRIERASLETVIQMVTDIHPMEVKYRNGKIFFFWQ